MQLTQLCRMAGTVVALAIAGPIFAQQVFVQSGKDFRAAFDNMSTSPSFVLITVIDGRSGARRTGCTMAGFLLHAVAKEEGDDRNDRHGVMLSDVAKQVKARILASKDHVYVFQKPEALAALPMDGERFDQACAIIRAGSPAYMQDRTGQIKAGWPSGVRPGG